MPNLSLVAACFYWAARFRVVARSTAHSKGIVTPVERSKGAGVHAEDARIFEAGRQLTLWRTLTCS